MSTGYRQYDLGLIIPTREEFDCIRDSVPFTQVPGTEKGFWYEFQVPGERLGVAHVLFDMGLVATTAAATRLLDRFDPGVLAVVGIGGALSDELRLGDVVVGSVIQEYLKNAKVSSGRGSRTAFQPAGDGWPLPERLRNFANNFRYIAPDSYRSWARFAKVRGVEADLPFATTIGARREPEYFVQPIASGDLVVTDPAFTSWLLSHDRKRAVIEMEGAGAARAVKEYDQDVALIVLRGISDFADEGKAVLDAVASGPGGGAWRRYAAQNAIELLIAFLAAPAFPWRKPPSSAAGQPAVAVPVSGEGVLPARSSRSWDYFMRAGDIAKVTAAGIGLVHALHPGQSPADTGSHAQSGHDADHGHGHDSGGSHHQEEHDQHEGTSHEPHGTAIEPHAATSDSAAHQDYGHHDDYGHDPAIDPDGHAGDDHSADPDY
jgi:nucleoside phosphorylase